MKVNVKCPAKINLTLKVFTRDKETGFHPIESIMQTVNLFDYLTVEPCAGKEIEFTGNSTEIPYDGGNIIIKACKMYFEYAKIKNEGLKIYLEKNIPVAAGLAGGSTDAAGILHALNHIYAALSPAEIFEINSKLGSDLNFCYQGGCKLAQGKGDVLTPLEFSAFNLTIVKPKGLKISTKTAYDAYDNLKEKSDLKNDLEFAILPLYPTLRKLHDLGFQMSGSGPSFFIKKVKLPFKLPEDGYDIFENLSSVDYGVKII